MEPSGPLCQPGMRLRQHRSGQIAIHNYISFITSHSTLGLSLCFMTQFIYLHTLPALKTHYRKNHRQKNSIRNDPDAAQPPRRDPPQVTTPQKHTRYTLEKSPASNVYKKKTSPALPLPLNRKPFQAFFYLFYKFYPKFIMFCF